MMSKLRRLILIAMKYSGFFSLSALLTKNDVRILCYHGVSVNDEHKFNGLLFMRKTTFQDRMKYLKKKFNVVSLDTAMEIAFEKRRVSYPVVITFDDGWFHTYKDSMTILKEFEFPATIYLTSYYASKDSCVLNVLIRYLAWKSNLDYVDMSWLSKNLVTSLPFDKLNKKQSVNKIIVELEKIPTLSERQEAVEKMFDCFGVERGEVKTETVFSLMNENQIWKARNAGMSIQLHTHRHQFPLKDSNSLKKEIVDNRNYLEPIVDSSLCDFCYPSGVYSPYCYKVLREMKIKTATTCEPGFVTKKSYKLALPRFLDGENISKIEFEAEMWGVLEIFRRLRKSCSKLFKI